MPKKRKPVQPKSTPPKKQLAPKSPNQAAYLDAIQRSDVTFCSGPAGSGKTSLAVGMACRYLLEGRVEKIVITRPVVESGKGLGFLPGTLSDKVAPYLVPIMEEMKLFLGLDTFGLMRGAANIELCPLEYMRGRNFHNSFILLDEAQNATLEQIKMFLTRLGMGSKAVVNGDASQTDLDHRSAGGFDFCMDRLKDVDGVSVCLLEGCDIVRNRIIASILGALQA